MNISEILYCPSVFVGCICLGQAWILNKLINQLRQFFGIKTIHGLTNITVSVDKAKYLLGCIYTVDQNEFRIHDIFKTNKCIAVTDKVFGSKHRDFDDCIEELSIKPFSDNNSLLKQSFKCIDKLSEKCVIVTKPSVEYSLSYLVLTLECFEKSIKFKTISILDDLVDFIVNTISEFIVDQCVRMKIDRSKCIEMLGSIDKYFLIFVSDLLSKNIISLPPDLDVNDVINYVKSIGKYR